MAESRSLSFLNFVLLLGNGAAQGEVFAKVGAFVSRQIKGKLETGSTQVPDAADDSALMSTELEGKTITFEVSGDGILNMATNSFGVMNGWFMSGLAKNVQLQLNDTLANGGGTYEGAAYLTDFTLAGKKAEKTTVSITLASTGLWAFVPSPN